MTDRVDHLRIGLTDAYNRLADSVAKQMHELNNRVAYFESQLHLLTLRTDMLDRARLEQGSDVRTAGEGIEDLDKRLEAHRDSAATHIARISRAVESLEFNVKHGAGPGATPSREDAVRHDDFSASASAPKHAHHRHPGRVIYALTPEMADRLKGLAQKSGDMELVKELVRQSGGR